MNVLKSRWLEEAFSTLALSVECAENGVDFIEITIPKIKGTMLFLLLRGMAGVRPAIDSGSGGIV